MNNVDAIAIGSLDDNPFPDATPAFFENYGAVLSSALNHPLQVIAPYRHQHKSQIIARFPDLPLHLTITCMAPVEKDGAVLHCSDCNKCRERREAFAAAGVPDRTPYAA
jgi:7-cyano-7-deazaguanine synthase